MILLLLTYRIAVFGLMFFLLGGAAVAAAQGTPDAQQSPAMAAAAARTGFVPEPRFIRRSIDFGQRTVGDGGTVKNGFYPQFSNNLTGAGWMSVGPGYRHWLAGDRGIFDTSAAVSWRMYKMVQARFELTRLARSRLALGSQVLWQDATQITYFGEGPHSREADRSEYRMKSVDFAGYATARPNRWLQVTGRLGWLPGPTLRTPAGTFERGSPSTQTVFPDNIVFARGDQPDYLHGEASITADTRNSRSYPTGGGVYRAVWTTYVDRDAGTFSFRRYEAEAAQFIPLSNRRVVLALHGRLIATDANDGRAVPFYLMPAIGGGNTLRAYADFRFHDHSAVVVNVESRFALMTHVDLAAFFDAGNVASRAGDLNLDKTSWGLGFRLHSARATLARVEMAHGAGGWRLVIRTSDPLHLTRLTRRTAALPFTP
jgi:hypothetical protein